MASAARRPAETAATLAGYAACAWALLFAAASFYWAAGGTAGVNTLSPSIQERGLGADRGFVALVWATGGLKLLAGGLALALIRPWGRQIPRRLLLLAGWGAGAFFALYGAANLAVRALMAIGVIGTPESMRSRQAYWHLVLWDPWWVAGGVLFLAAAWSYQRRSRARGRAVAGSRR